MQSGDHLGAVADRRGDPLDRAGADVADGEDAAPAGFERQSAVAGARRRCRTKPRSSTLDAATRRSQSVLGSAPMNRNRWLTRGARPRPDARSRQRDRFAARRPSPSSARDLGAGDDLDIGAGWSMRSTR